ncbi:uncharacterized protein LOC143462622 [Clavelina lepadiformis]|uniref:uncharacterized protein LOC143462622 n=1 Tax=Clavelina lepadiformis TaxID=159417 RepID=UPI0040419632
MKIFVKVGILLAFIVTRGSALWCFQCHHIPGSEDTSCFGPDVDRQYLQECWLSEHVSCGTSIAKTNPADEPVDTTIARECSKTNSDEHCGENEFGDDVCYYYCSGDGCNSRNDGTPGATVDVADSSAADGNNGFPNANAPGPNANTPPPNTTVGTTKGTTVTVNNNNNTTMMVSNVDNGRSDNNNDESYNSGSLVQASLLTLLFALVYALVLIKW